MSQPEPQLVEPQPGPAGPTVATLRRRTAAGFLDSMVATPVMGVLAGLVWLADRGLAKDLLSGIAITNAATPTRLLWAGAAGWLILSVSCLLVSTIPASRSGDWRGQTFGERALGIRLLRRDGSLPSVPLIWCRGLLVSAIFGGGLVALGLILDVVAGTQPVMTNALLITVQVLIVITVLYGFAGDERRLLHDRLFGTVVARTSLRVHQIEIGADEAVTPASASASSLGGKPVGRPRTNGTWLLGGAALLMQLCFVTFLVVVAVGAPTREEWERATQQPGAAQAIRHLRALEPQVKRCLREEEDAAACARPERYDIPEGARYRPSGTPGSLDFAQEDGTVYVTTIANDHQTWSIGVDSLVVARICIVDASGETCPGVPEEGW